MAIFSKMVSLDPAVSLQNLAQLRPEVVLPDLLDRYVYYVYTRVTASSLKCKRITFEVNSLFVMNPTPFHCVTGTHHVRSYML